MKRFGRLLAALIASMLLISGCAFSEQDASQYVQSVLDCIYRGETDSYQKLTDSSEEAAKLLFDTNLEQEAKYFCSYFDFSDSDKTRLLPELTDFYRELYSKANYQVEKALQSENGYEITVTIRPIDLFVQAQEEITAYIADLQEQLNAGAYADMNETDFYAQYADHILEICKGYLEKTDGLDTESITVVLTKDPDGFYEIGEQDLQKIDSRIIEYPQSQN